MAETGWPLIPREVLPAPVPAVRPARRPLPGVAPADLGRQLSIFGAETTEPSPADLAGLLAGPARLGRMGGTARVSVRVDAAWRVHVLVNELVRRGLVVTWHPVEKSQNTEKPINRTASPAPEADDTSDPPSGHPDAPDYDDEPGSAVIGGARHADAQSPSPDPDEPPPGPVPESAAEIGESESARPESAAETSENESAGHGSTGTGGEPESAAEIGDAPARDAPAAPEPDVMLFDVRTAYSSRLSGLARAWPAAAGQLFLSGPRLRLWVAAAGRPEAGGYALGLDPAEDPTIVDAALVRAGLAGTVSDDGRYYLILGKKRLARLAELVGERPREAPEALWPSGATA